MKYFYRLPSHSEQFLITLSCGCWLDSPTYDRTLFDPQIHTWEKIAQAMCQAELVHEKIALLSFLPITAGIWFGAYPVFVVTSVLAAGCDMLFVMMQRYNRQRIMTLLKREKNKK